MAEGESFDPARLGEILRQARTQHPDQPTLDEVAKRVGVHLSMIGNVEKGIVKPSEETLRRWLPAVGLPDSIADDWLDALALGAIDDTLAGRGVAAAERSEVRGYLRYVLSRARAAPLDRSKAV